MVRINHEISPYDADLTTRIGIAFATRPRISWHDIDVSVTHGIVTLRGDVPTPYDRQLVVAVTRHVAGVLGINDELRIIEAASRKEEEPPREISRVQSRLSSWAFSESDSNGRHFLRAGVFVLALAILTLTGCGEESNRVPVHPVHGAIEFRGQPAVGAFVALHPQGAADASAPSPRGTVGPDGKFNLTTYEGADGAPAGEYVLTVQWYKPVKQGNDTVGGPNVLPAKYANARTSDVRVTIAAGENRIKAIQLR